MAFEFFFFFLQGCGFLVLLDSGEVRSFLIDSDLFLYSDLEILCNQISDRTMQSVGWHPNRNFRAVLFKCDHSVSLAQSL